MLALNKHPEALSFGWVLKLNCDQTSVTVPYYSRISNCTGELIFSFDAFDDNNSSSFMIDSPAKFKNDFSSDLKINQQEMQRISEL